MERSAITLPISLVIPAFRAERYIERAIASVRDDAAVPSEIIVVDDASDDRTVELAAAAGAHVIRLTENGGPSVARNVGVAAARERWVAFLDADDVWIEGKLLAQWEALQRWPDAGFCFTDYDVIDAEGALKRNEMAGDSGYARLIAEERHGKAARYNQFGFVRGLVRSMFIRQSSAIVSRELFLRIGGYDETLRLAEDYDLFLRLVGIAPAVIIAHAYVTYLRQPLSLSSDPLAEVRAMHGLWTTILEQPQRYPLAAVELIRRRRIVPLRRGCRIALRLGRFADAATFARRAMVFDRSLQLVALLGLAMVLNNRVGMVSYAAFRRTWRKLRPTTVQGSVTA